MCFKVFLPFKIKETVKASERGVEMIELIITLGAFLKMHFEMNIQAFAPHFLFLIHSPSFIKSIIIMSCFKLQITNYFFVEWIKCFDGKSINSSSSLQLSIRDNCFSSDFYSDIFHFCFSLN